MTRLLTASMALALGTVVALPSHARDAAPGGEELGKVVQAEGEAFIKQGRSDGLSIAVVRDGQVSFYNFGTVSREKPQAPTKDTVYEIGSISKTFGSLLLAQSIVAGKAKASDELHLYLPGDYANLAYQGHPIRLIDLVNTTSGLPDNLPDIGSVVQGVPPDQVPAKVVEMFNGLTQEAMLKDLKGVSLQTQPGTASKHSNVAAELVGVTVSRVEGQPFEVLLASRIEKPFGMQSGVGNERQALRAIGYNDSGVVAPALMGTVILPAGGLHYSAADMAQYITAQLKSDDAAVALTHRPAWNGGGKTIGYNWTIGTTMDGEQRLSHTGGTLGFSSFVDLFPDSHYGIVLLANRSSPTLQGQLWAMSDSIQRRVWGESPGFTALKAQLEKEGYAKVGVAVTQVHRTYPQLTLSEDEVNRWGYSLLRDKRTKEAISVFAFNTEQHPQSANAFDSLAEARRANGDIPQSLRDFRRSLELNPGNDNARKQIAELEAAGDKG
ncbi:serine hydrolase domain-containing protein [Dyella amyloliquefaciens]|uniref:serine hydrolase domain-containing protein n=1 Tax=Dyella amyloliquefaciens TaxID=1770545 RepID=UPI00102EA3BB|nr:serine hydrolase domain-containing protein [Dyella amyloliquefaciens]